VDLDAAREHIRTHSHAILATLRSDGSPQLSPVAVTIDDEGRAIVSSRETAFKVLNLRRTGRGWLCVFPDAFYGPWIQVEGLITIVSLPEAMEPLVDYYRRLSGEHPDWDDYRAAMEREERCLIRFELTRAGPDRAG
jgi:PPOX class probable F420-dependent enzyme